MSDCSQCTENLNRAHQSGSPWNMCPDEHCDETIAIIHDYCHCQGPFSGFPYVQNGLCTTGPGTLIPIASKSCYCCCDCTGNGMSIATSDHDARAIQEFNVNDLVWVAKDSSLKIWVQKPVLFSSGTGDQSENKLFSVHFDDHKTRRHITAKSFVSQAVTQQQADAYYKILSTPPNEFINKNGRVNLAVIRQTNPVIISELLSVPEDVATQIFITLSSGSNHLLVPGAQPFLMKDGTLKQAEKLIPGKDVLLHQDGSTSPVISLEAGIYKRGIHHLATSVEKATSLEDHLLLLNGIVIGDYAAQIAMSAQNSPIKDHYKDDPALGSKAYNQANSNLVTTALSAHIKIK